jgi:hypothetical protein
MSLYRKLSLLRLSQHASLKSDQLNRGIIELSRQSSIVIGHSLKVMTRAEKSAIGIIFDIRSPDKHHNNFSRWRIFLTLLEKMRLEMLVFMFFRKNSKFLSSFLCNFKFTKKVVRKYYP